MIDDTNIPIPDKSKFKFRKFRLWSDWLNWYTATNIMNQMIIVQLKMNRRGKLKMRSAKL